LKVKRQLPASPPSSSPAPATTAAPSLWDLLFATPEVLKKNHKSNSTSVNPSAKVDWTLLGQNKSVILSPEVTEGPFCKSSTPGLEEISLWLWPFLDVSGEVVRKDIKDNEKGVNMHLDVQVMDVNTCEALKDIAVEIWAANATVNLQSTI
jgi:hypothetical protein